MKQLIINEKLSLNTLYHRAIYLFFCAVFFATGIFLVVASFSHFFHTSEDGSQSIVLGLIGFFSLLVGWWMGKKGFAFIQESTSKKRHREKEASDAAKNSDLERRKNNPYLANTEQISLFGSLIIYCALAVFGLLWYFTKDDVFGWVVGVFCITSILFSFATDLEGKRVTGFEKSYIDFVVVISHSFKWLSLLAIGASVVALITGWLSALSATTIIIFLLILILLKQK